MITRRPSPVAEDLGVEVGTIFYRSWGYDETHVDFYQVVEISPSGKSVKLRQIRRATMDRGVVALKDQWVDDDASAEIFTKRLQLGYGSKAVTAFNSYSSLSVWDGTPQYDTRALGYEGH